MIQKLNLGAAPNDKTGTKARVAGQMINANFDYLEAKIDNVDKLVSETGFSLVGQEIWMNAGWQWLINGISYSNPVLVKIPIPFAATGNERIDLIVLNTSNTFTRIPGTESVSNPAVEPVPNDTVQATLVVVTDGVIEEPTAPISGDAYVAKTESTFTKLSGSGAKAQFSIYNEMTNVRVIAASSIGSVSIPDKKYIYAGKDHYVKNENGTTLLIAHNSGTGNYKYFFPNATDLVVQNNEIVHFKFRFATGNSGFLDYVGVASSGGGGSGPVAIADVTGLTAELADRYTKSEVDAKVASVYVFKGNVANYAALPSSGQTIGWTYNLNDTGANYAWTGTDWDKLGDTIDISGKENSSNKSQDIETDKASTTKFGSVKAFYDWCVGRFQPKLVAGANIAIDNTNPLAPVISASSGGGGDMVLASTQTVSGLKTFLAGMFGLRNVANTFTSYFTNTNTASRTYTLQNKDYTIADNADLANKMNNPAGTVNYLSKFLTASTIGLSRLFDDGTFFGIGTANTPTKDFTLGNQADREIGVEQSNNTTKGRDLIVSAGRAINFVPSNGFSHLANGVNYKGGTGASNGDLYFTGNNKIYKQTGGAGTIADYNQTVRGWCDMTSLVADNYAVCGTGDIYKQANNTGDFIAIGEVSRNYIKITSSPSGNLYALVSNGDVYKKTGAGVFTAMGVTSPQVLDIAVSNDNNVYTINGTTNCVYKQTNETGSFVPYLLTALPYPQGIAVSKTSNSIYLATYGFGVYKQTNQTGAFSAVTPNANTSADLNVFIADNGNVYVCKENTGLMIETNYVVGAPNLDGGSYKAKAGTGKGTGKSRFEIYTGQKTTSGTDMQIEVLREYVDENGYHIYVSIPVYSDNTSAIAGGLPIGCEYRTSTGVKMIVY
jgi:hypothetical protein